MKMKISTVLKAVLVIWGVISLGCALAAAFSSPYDLMAEIFPYLTSAILSFGLAWVVELQDNGS